jgi:hypothetical protein
MNYKSLHVEDEVVLVLSVEGRFLQPNLESAKSVVKDWELTIMKKCGSFFIYFKL